MELLVVSGCGKRPQGWGIEDLKQLAHQLNVPLDAKEDVSILKKPVQAGRLGPPLYIPNSLAVHPMEGCDGDYQGAPAELTFRRYERFAAGGAGLIWVEAIAVVPEGRSNQRQLWLNENSKDGFAALVTLIKEKAAKENGPAHRPIIVAQLTHSGRYSKPVSYPVSRIPCLERVVGHKSQSIIPTDEQLDKLVDCFVKAAEMAYEAGFDAVDIKACHGYLVNELLASHRREGKYGGSFENRSRFLLEVIDKIHKELGEDKPIATRLSIYDAIAYPYGWAVLKNSKFRNSKSLVTSEVKPDLTEPKRLIALLEKRGVRIINITAGYPRFNPHYGRPSGQFEKFEFQNSKFEIQSSPEHPLIGVARLIGLAGEIQKQFPDIAIVGTGYSWLGTLFPNVAAASKAKGLATIIGAGRLALAYPDFARDIITKGQLDGQKVCITCGACVRMLRAGEMTGCVVRDNKIYGPIYKQLIKRYHKSGE